MRLNLGKVHSVLYIGVSHKISNDMFDMLQKKSATKGQYNGEFVAVKELQTDKLSSKEVKEFVAEGL